MNIKTLVLSVILALLLITGCSANTAVNTNETVTALSDLVGDPASYAGQTITIEGHVAADLGEYSYFVPYPYYDLLSNTTKISLSQVRVQRWKISDGNNYIEVVSKSGGIYLPLPIVPVGRDRLSENLIVWGTWTKVKVDKEEKYVLNLNGYRNLE